MAYVITAFIAGMFGFMIGLFAFGGVNLSNNRILEASTVCAVNSDLEKIVVTPTETTAYCLNGAVFKLKEK